MALRLDTWPKGNAYGLLARILARTLQPLLARGGGAARGALVPGRHARS